MGRRKRTVKSWFGGMLWSIDVLANMAFFGRKGETISSRWGRKRRQGRLQWYLRPFERFLNAIDEDHVEDSINWMVELGIAMEKYPGLKAEINALVDARKAE